MIVTANSIVQDVIQIKNGTIKHVNGNVKIIVRAKKIIVRILALVFVKILSVLKVMDIVSTKKRNTIATNVTSSASINCHIKKVRDCSIFHTVLLAVILLLIIIIIGYHYARQRGTEVDSGSGCGRHAPPFFVITCFFCNHFEKLQTVLSEVELIINNAPLTYVYPNTIETCLTPNTTSTAVRNLTVPSSTTDEINRIINHYLDRWRHEFT